MLDIKIGWAQIGITPDRPVYNRGQIYPRVSKYVHDPITATALALDNGQAQVIVVSLDLVAVPEPEVISQVRENLASLDGFLPVNLSISVTHTHNSIHPHPLIFDSKALEMLGEERIMLPTIPDNILAGEELNNFLAERITVVATQAWNNRRRGGISSASDYAAIAFNRRPVFECNNTSETIMYGVCSRDDFVRYESGSDHSADMIYTWSDSGDLLGIVVCIPCPSQVFELHSFLSADYWHYTRQALRKKFGQIYILPLCGAAGDQSPIDLTRISKYNEKELVAWGAQAGEVLRNFDMADTCRDIANRITDAVKRGYDKGCNSIESHPPFAHQVHSLHLPIRKVTEDDYRKAVIDVKAVKNEFNSEKQMTGADLVAIFEPMGVISRYHQQMEKDYVDVMMRSIRIGTAAIITCPFELFVEYSVRIKARAVSKQTIVVQLTDQSYGYLPTHAAIHGGSYSSAPASTTCGPACGDILVDAAVQAIASLWNCR